MFESKYRYPIAIHFADEAVCAAQLKETSQGLAVIAVSHQPLNGSAEKDPEGIVSALKSISKNGGFKGKRAVAHLPFNKVFSLPVKLQVGPEETVEGAIVREAKGYLPFPLEKAVLDYSSLLEISSGAARAFQATVIAAREEDILEYTRFIEKAGLSLEAVDSAVSSMYRLHEYLFGPSEHPDILCHIGWTQTLAAVLKKDGILGERVIPWGTRSLMKKINENMELKDDLTKVKLLLRDYGLSNECRSEEEKKTAAGFQESIRQIVYQIVSPCIEELVDEIHRLTAYVRSDETQTTFKGIYLYGQSIWIRDLDVYVSRRLNLPTSNIDPSERLPIIGGTLLSNFMDRDGVSLALGLGMRKVAWL